MQARRQLFLRCAITLILTSPILPHLADADIESDAGVDEIETANSGEGTPDEDLRAEVARQNREIEVLKEKLQAIEQQSGKENDKEIEVLKEKVAVLETQSEMEADEDFAMEMPDQEMTERHLDLYGFFDLTLFYFDSPEDSLVDALLPNKLSFVINRLHLYVKSQMTDALSALIELRFTFLPLGHENSYTEPVYFGTEYDRVDTTVSDPGSTEELRLGGLVIERVHLTWKPADFFGVIAGRFLTPFGIWNIDHGSPVVLPIGLPYFMVRQALPPAQTGLQVFGRFYPFHDTYIDYAITLSNGRGPTESVYDLDNNKALGGRLRLSYEGDKIGTALGAYLYWGDTTDVTKEVTNLDPFEVKVENTLEYTELTGSVDVLIRFYGLRIQSEFIRGIVHYSVQSLRTIPILEVADPFRAYQPDHIKWGIYGLVAYAFPLRLDTVLMFLTPYFMTEFYTPDDTFEDFYQTIYRLGLNFRPSPYATLKVEANRSDFPRSEMNEGFWAYLAQVAVSF